MKTIKSLSFLLLLVLCGGCRLTRTVYLQIDEELAPLFTELKFSHPLPENFLYTREKEIEAAFSIRIHSRRWDDPRPQATPLLQRVLERKFFAPAMDFRQDQEEPPILPLDKIRLPLTASPWQGLTIADASYPLVEEMILTCDHLRGKEIPRQLREWFDSLPAPPSPPALCWLGAVGDIMPGEGAQDLFFSGGCEAVFTNTLPILQRSDLMIGNLEAVATEHTQKTPKSFNYQFAPQLLGQLREAGFDYMAFANNHCYDYGEKGFKDTLAYLDTYHIPTSGAGLTPAQAAVPWKAIFKNLPVTILSLGAFPRERTGFDGPTHAVVTPQRAGILWADEAGFTAMQKAFTRETFNIVYIHGGYERTLTPRADQRALYKRCIDTGADLVLGSHPHALQGLEVYKNKLIAYSLGNFIFPDEVIYPYATVSAVLQLGIYQQQVLYIRLHSVKMQGSSATLDASGAGKQRILELSRKLTREKH